MSIISQDETQQMLLLKQTDSLNFAQEKCVKQKFSVCYCIITYRVTFAQLFHHCMYVCCTIVCMYVVPLAEQIPNRNKSYLILSYTIKQIRCCGNVIALDFGSCNNISSLQKKIILHSRQYLYSQHICIVPCGVLNTSSGCQ